MKKKRTIELTPKEAYLLWILACWFDRPITDNLKFKLADIVGVDSEERRKFDKRFEKEILTQLAKTGSWIKKRHPEWLEKEKK